MPYVPVGEPRDVPGFQGFSAGSQAEEAALDEQYAQRTLTAQELKAPSAVQDEEVDYGSEAWFLDPSGSQAEEAALDLCAEQYAQRTLTAQELKALSAVQDEEVDDGSEAWFLDPTCGFKS